MAVRSNKYWTVIFRRSVVHFSSAYLSLSVLGLDGHLLDIQYCKTDHVPDDADHILKYPDVTIQNEGFCCFQLHLYTSAVMVDQSKAHYSSTLNVAS
jgi:hypothetical protein